MRPGHRSQGSSDPNGGDASSGTGDTPGIVVTGLDDVFDVPAPNVNHDMHTARGRPSDALMAAHHAIVCGDTAADTQGDGTIGLLVAAAAVAAIGGNRYRGMSGRGVE